MIEIAKGFEQFQVAPGMLGVSDVMKQIGKQLKIAAADEETYDTILLTGETGAGKDVAAKAIYEEFKQKKNKSREIPFVHVDICAIAPELLESELFGHIKGAYTGAINDRIGLIRSANGGVLYLDEIGDMPMTLQVKLLHFIHDRTIRPVGSDKEQLVVTKLILGTNRDLQELMKADKFRQDLFYRIARIMIEIPPLRQRKDDIPVLVKHHLHQTNGGVKINDEAILRLQQHLWPGNVRMLLSVISNAIFLMQQRSDTNGKKIILIGDVDTSKFDGAVSEEIKDLLFGSVVQETVAEMIAKGLKYEVWCDTYKLALLTEIPGTIVFKKKLSDVGRATVYRWLVELGVENLLWPAKLTTEKR